MNFLSFTIEAAPVQATLTRIEKTSADLKPVVQSALRLEQLVRNTFRDQRSPWGFPWPALSDATIANRVRRGNFSKGPLLDTLKMYDSIQTAQSASDVFVSVDYAPSWPVVHQFGNPNNHAWGGPLAPVPARPFFPLRDENTVDVPDEWMTELYEPIGQAFADAITNSIGGI